METLTLTDKSLRIGMVLTIAVLLMSCGSDKTINGSSDQLSRILPPTTGTGGNKPMAYCSQALNSTSSLKTVLGTVYDTYGKVDPNYVSAKVMNVTDAFKDNNSYVAFWKWYAESSGFTYVSSSPLSFKVVNIQTSQEITGYLTTLSWSSISSIASSIGATTPSQFFQKVRFLVYLNDPSAQYDALTVGIHQSNDGVAISRVDALIPVFSADPRDYAVEPNGSARAAVLQRLHPFYNSDYSLWSATTFTLMSNDLCAPLTQY